MFKPLFAGDNEYYWMLRGRNYSPLLLSAEASMNIAPSVVNTANLKSQLMTSL